MDLSIKDFFPLIGTVLTVLTGYIFLTAQVRKNRRVKWVDDFRRETGTFVALSMHLSGDSTFEEVNQVNIHASIIQMYLSSKNKSHNVLLGLIAQVMVFYNYKTPEEKKAYANMVSQIIKEARAIIEAEQAKI